MRHALLPLLLLAATLAAGDAEALPVAVAPDHARLRWSGRWDTTQPAGPRCEWPAGQVCLRFAGTALNVLLAGPKDHAFQVAIDGKAAGVITLVQGQTIYRVASDLPAGEHLVELCKRTECWGGPVQVRGFQLAAGGELRDVPAFARRVEFIGDSITAGYGNEAASKEEHFSFATENAWLAWGAVAARALDAELMCEAISGIRLQGAADKKPMPALWAKTMPFTASKDWDFTRWQADAVVVNLGTNDMNNKQLPLEEGKWREAYLPFIAAIRAAYPKAHIFLTIGPMGHGKDGIIPKANAAIVEELAKAGDARIHSLALPNQRQEDGIGADWHPSAKTHQKMADAIAAAIRKELGWKE